MHRKLVVDPRSNYYIYLNSGKEYATENNPGTLRQILTVTCHSNYQIDIFSKFRNIKMIKTNGFRNEYPNYYVQLQIFS